MSVETFEFETAGEHAQLAGESTIYAGDSKTKKGVSVMDSEPPWEEYEQLDMQSFQWAPAKKEKEEDPEDWPDSDLESDESINGMIRTASVQRYNRMLANVEERLEAPLRILPTLHLSPYDAPFLRFRLGSKKLYLIKNIPEFITAYSNSSKFEISQKHSVIPLREAFYPQALMMLDFIVLHHRTTGANRDYCTQRLQLTSAVVDEFFSIIQDGDILDVVANGYSTISDGAYTVRKTDVSLNFELLPAQGGVLLSRVSDYQVIQGQRGPYIVMEDVIYCPGKDFQQRCGYFINRMTKQKKPAFISYRDLSTFMMNIVRETEDYLYFDGDQFHQRFQDTRLQTKIWFDVAEDGGITSHMNFYYGNRSHKAFGNKDLSKVIDYAGERRAERLLMRYMGNRVSKPNTLYLSNDDNKIFNLISRGMSQLEDIADVIKSEEFKKIRVRKKTRVNIGVRVDGDLLVIDFDPKDLDFQELADVLSNYDPAQKYWRLKDGSYLSLEDNAITDLVNFAEGLELTGQEIMQGSVTVSVDKAPFVDCSLKKNEDIRYERDDAFRSIIRNFHEAADADYPLPKGLVDVLRNYQKTGFRWLKTLNGMRFGGILADDMGLGKTIQTLAFIESERVACKERVPSIVVCPASVVLNWQSEANRFTPKLKTTALIGNKETREQILQRISEYDLVVTSYGLLLRDIDEFEKLTFRCIVLDEAQNIKNQVTQSAKAVKRLHGLVRFALTGTPVENSLAELWSIFDFILPGYLKSYNHFTNKYEKPIVLNNDTLATERLRDLVRPFILRRMKKEVLRELPEKTESVLPTEMTEEQNKVYTATRMSVIEELMQKPEDTNEGVKRIEILSALTRLRQICCDPSLVFSNYEGGSAKLDACMELIQNSMESGHRMLLFSQFTSMINIIQQRLDLDGIRYYRLDGSTPKEDRQKLMNDFNTGDVPVFLISLRAGGTGLNLTGADVVIHYDPWWNLSVQNQASARAHRIGQVNNVQVFKLIAKDTIEERILELQQKKRRLSDSIIQDGGDVFASMTYNELMDLFKD